MSGPGVVSPKLRRVVADQQQRHVIEGGVDWISTTQGSSSACEQHWDTPEGKAIKKYHHVYLNPDRKGADPTLVYHTPVQTHDIERMQDVSGFETGSATLNPRMRAELAKQIPAIMEQLQRNPNHVIHIAGHTDTTGGDEINVTLSEKRAQAVVSFLKEMLPEPYRSRAMITSQGKADTELKVEQPGACAANRRVELHVAEVKPSASRSYVHASPAMQAYTSVLPMKLDFGLGSETQQVYGTLSGVEARTDLILEARISADGKPISPARFNIICQNPENLTILLQGPTNSCSLLGDTNNPNRLQVRRDGVLVAVVNIQTPDGTVPDLSKVQFGTVNNANIITPQKTLVFGKSTDEIAKDDRTSPTSPPTTPPTHRLVSTKHTGPAL